MKSWILKLMRCLLLIAMISTAASLAGCSGATSTLHSSPAGHSDESRAQPPPYAITTSSVPTSIPESPLPITNPGGGVVPRTCEVANGIAVATGFYAGFDTTAGVGSTLVLDVYDPIGANITSGATSEMKVTNTVWAGATNWQAETTVLSGFTPASCTVSIDTGTRGSP